jgi:excisionase family DNA binding protein
MEQKSMAMTPASISADTGLHINTIYRLLKENKIPHVKLSRAYLISRAEYAKWLSGQSTRPPATG